MSETFDVGRLASDLQSLVRDAEEALRATLASGGDRAQDARERAEASIDAMRERLDSLRGELRGRARELDEYVRDNPWQAVAVVGGIALVLGLILRRR